MPYKVNFNQIDKSKLNVFTESRKRRIFVGTLSWNEVKNSFKFEYDPKYLKSKIAIPIGKELDLFKQSHISRHKLFPSFVDRIPSRENPAYEDYCRSQGISAEETNPIILLISIGKRGPSTFIFEPMLRNKFSFQDVKEFRKTNEISIHDFALAFDLNPPTLIRLESGKKADLSTIRRIQIYLSFPRVALWQLEMNAGKLHHDTFKKLWTIFEKRSA